MNSSQQDKDMTMVWLSGVILLVLLLAFSYSTYSTCLCSQQTVEQPERSDFKSLTETLFTAPVPVTTPMPFVVQPSELVVPSVGGIVLQGGTNNYIRVAGTATTDATRNTVGTTNNQIQIYNAGNLTAAFDVDGLYVRALNVTGNSTVGGTLGVTGNTTVGGTLGVTGNTTVGGTLGVTGNTTVGGTLGVTGNTTVGGTLGVTGNITVNTFFTLAASNASVTFGNGSLTSAWCVSMGDGALSKSTGAGSVANTAIGYLASNNNTTGSQNTSIGYIAGRDVTTGTYNTCVGANAGHRVTTGNYNTYVGMQAGPVYDPSTASLNTCMGYLSGSHITTSNENTCMGYISGANITTGVSNTCIGSRAGGNIITGQYNTALGQQALVGGIGGIGNYNTSIGHFTHVDMTTGGNNIALGAGAGKNITTGEFNIHIGRDVHASSPSVSDEIVIGRNIPGKGANTCYIGSTTTYLNNVNVSGTITGNLSGTTLEFTGFSVATTFELVGGANRNTNCRLPTGGVTYKVYISQNTSNQNTQWFAEAYVSYNSPSGGGIYCTMVAYNNVTVSCDSEGYIWANCPGGTGAYPALIRWQRLF
jgi:hypothetical protein